MKKLFFTAVMLMIGVALFAQDPTPTPEKSSLIWQILSGVLLVTSMFFATQWSKVQSKVFQALFVLKEAIELVEYVVQASPGGFTETEQARIIKEAQDVRTAWRTLLGKSI